MMNTSTDLLREPGLAALDASVERAAAALSALQRDDGHWVFELEADATIPSEYVLLRHYLGEEDDLELERRIGNYLRRTQADHDGWPLFHGGPFDLSASIKAYFALKMIGDRPDAPHMTRARTAILAAGGASASNVFTRIQLALFAQGGWNVPAMPPELILLPKWFPIHLSKMSYWARTVIVPLLVLLAIKPTARNRRGVDVAELFVSAKTGTSFDTTGRKRRWVIGFRLLDRLLKSCDGLWPKQLRQHAIDSCVSFVRIRLNGEDGLGAIYPAMANSVMMFDALGYPPEHPDRATARSSLEKLLVVHDDEAYCQPCVSPVWDTALATHALLETGLTQHDDRLRKAFDWLAPLQILDLKGDWADARPDVRPGGWAFQYRNDHYPDLDDTAVVVMAMDRARHQLDLGARHDVRMERAREWTVGMQSSDGGWGAFDADNSHHYLNEMPFSDHGALLDPPTTDVTARCISMLAQAGESTETRPLTQAIHFLEREQLEDGSWFGRWGVNYIYGTWSALCALNAADFDHASPVMRKAVDWLVAIQNGDGGWGESCESYALAYDGYQAAPSTASQTAWALLGMMAAGQVDHPAVARGIRYLQERQAEDGLWNQDHYTGGGFPRVFYLRYHGYPKFFPLWAMARYRNLRRANDTRVAYGM